jgi:hypothetical protein
MPKRQTPTRQTPSRQPFRSTLAGGPRLGVARVCEVVESVLAQPRKTAELIECLWDQDPGVVSRAADALEKASHRRPELLAPQLAPWKTALLGLLAEATEIKLRWNLALLVPRLTLTKTEIRRAAGALQTYLEDRSSIVKTCAMQGLARLTRQDPSLLPEVLDLVRILARSGTPAMRARGRILLKELEPRESPQKQRPLLRSAARTA